MDNKKQEPPNLGTQIEILELTDSYRIVVGFHIDIDNEMSIPEVLQELDNAIMESRNLATKKLANKLGVDVSFTE